MIRTLRITRTGEVFNLYTRPDDQSPWVLRDTVSRPDIGSGTDMQVGLWFATFFSGDQGSAQFTDFHLGAAKPLMPPSRHSPPTHSRWPPSPIWADPRT